MATPASHNSAYSASLRLCVKTLSAALITFLSVTANALPLVWRADWPAAKPVETLVHRGTDIEFQPQWYINGELANSTNWTFTTFVQTNAQATGEWFGPLPGAAFSHTNDIGAAFYNVMVRAQMPGGGVNYTAFARLRMLDSPGYTPGELPLLVSTIDFSKVIALNAPWLDKSGGSVTGDIRMPTGQLDAGDVVTRSYFDFSKPDEEFSKYLDSPENSGRALTVADLANSDSTLSTALAGKQDTLPYPTNAIPYDAILGKPTLANLTFDLSDEQGVMAALKACVEALGGSVTNMPAAH